MLHLDDKICVCVCVFVIFVSDIIRRVFGQDVIRRCVCVFVQGFERTRQKFGYRKIHFFKGRHTFIETFRRLNRSITSGLLENNPSYACGLCMYIYFFVSPPFLSDAAAGRVTHYDIEAAKKRKKR